MTTAGGTGGGKPGEQTPTSGGPFRVENDPNELHPYSVKGPTPVSGSWDELWMAVEVRDEYNAAHAAGRGSVAELTLRAALAETAMDNLARKLTDVEAQLAEALGREAQLRAVIFGGPHSQQSVDEWMILVKQTMGGTSPTPAASWLDGVRAEAKAEAFREAARIVRSDDGVTPGSQEDEALERAARALEGVAMLEADPSALTAPQRPPTAGQEGEGA